MVLISLNRGSTEPTTCNEEGGRVELMGGGRGKLRSNG